MSAHTSPWLGRRVLVTDATELLGSAVTRELLARGAVVAGFVPDPSAAAWLARDRDAGRFHPVRGQPGDIGRLRTAVAVHEASVVFDPTAAYATSRAAGPVPVVAVRPAGELRLADPAAIAPRGVVRFGEVFGPGDRRPDGPVARAVVGCLAGDPPPAGGPVRDYVFAPDAARAWLAVAEAVLAGESPDHTFRSGWELSDRDLAAAVAAALAADRPAADPFAAALAETAAWHREFLRRPAADARPARRAA
ncbi:MAG: hypothetical protein C0501_28240 [Isosphaera sp.]|nr:hypothetical protein [Isosphaera sp.]